MASTSLTSSIEQRFRNTTLENRSPFYYLGSFVCNVLGDKAYLYLRQEELEAHIYNRKGEVAVLSSSQIQGGREGNMPLEELVQLVQTVSASFLFASYHNYSLRIFARDFQDIQKNQFLRPRLKLSPDFFECATRKDILKNLREALEEKHTIVLVKDVKVPLKRVGKTELAQQYLKEYDKNYNHIFWVQSFDPWYLQKDLEDIANELQIQIEEIPHFLETNPSYLLIFDSIEDPKLIEKYLVKDPKGHILTTSRSPLWNIQALQVGLLAKGEGTAFLLKHTKGTEEQAEQVAQALGYVPSSLYRAVETITVEDLTLSTYRNYRETRLEKHTQMATKTSNLPSRNRDFIGREADLVALEESFSANKPVVLAANAGLGGIGKTQIALQYAYRTCPEYNLIWWINATNLDLSYDALAQRFGISLTDEEKREEHAIVKKINRYLERNPGWLLIFDDVENEASVKGLLPESGGHVLITTRSPNWNQTQVEAFNIQVFKREESIELILKVTGLYGHEIAADQLAQELQDLPLAIAQAAAYIRETGVSIEKYIEDFKKWHKALWKRESPTNNYEFTVNVTWNVSMEKIQEEERKEEVIPWPTALPLMQFCSFLAPNDIPREHLLLEWLKREYEKRENPLVNAFLSIIPDQEEFRLRWFNMTTEKNNTCLSYLNYTLKLLSRYSIIDIKQGAISIHNLVQTVTRDQIARENYEECLIESLEVLRNETKSGRDLNLMRNPMLHKRITPLFQHVETLLVLLKKYEENFLKNHYKQILKILEYLCIVSYFDGDYQLSKRKAKELVQFVRHYAKEDSLELARSLNKLGASYEGLEQLESALLFKQESLKIFERILGETHYDMAACYNSIASTFFRSEKYKEAYEYYEKAIKILESFPNKCSINNLALFYQNMGCTILKLGKAKESIDYFKKALGLLKSNDSPFLRAGDVSVDKAVCYNSIGIAWLQLERSDLAFDYLKKALEAWKQNFDKPHPYVVQGYKNVGDTLILLGKYDEALVNLTEALKSGKKVYPINHPFFTKAYLSVANVLKKLGKDEEAINAMINSL